MTIALPSSRLFLVFLASMTGGLTLGWAQPASEGTPPAVLTQQAPAPALPGLAAPAAATASQNLPARSPLPAASAASSRAFTPAATSPVAPPKAWNELSAPQQQALKPLDTNWNSIDEPQKRKWLAVSKNFGSMTPAEQAKLATTPNANPPRGGASGTSPAAARAASAPRQIDQKTLLPRKVASAP